MRGPMSGHRVSRSFSETINFALLTPLPLPSAPEAQIEKDSSLRKSQTMDKNRFLRTQPLGARPDSPGSHTPGTATSCSRPDIKPMNIIPKASNKDMSLVLRDQSPVPSPSEPLPVVISLSQTPQPLAFSTTQSSNDRLRTSGISQAQKSSGIQEGLPTSSDPSPHGYPSASGNPPVEKLSEDASVGEAVKEDKYETLLGRLRGCIPALNRV